MHTYNGARGRNSFILKLGNLPAGQYLAAVVARNAGGVSVRHTLKLKITATVTKPPVSVEPPIPSNPIPAPPKPPTVPTLPKNFTNPTPPTTTSPTPITPPQAKTWGQTGKATTLVLYDTTGQYGWIGELDAIAAGNLASHFGKITAEPVVDYQSGQINQYTGAIYIGSTYNEPIPTTFLDDVLGTTHPVIWAGENIWQLSGSGSADSAFMAKYGWDPSTSSFDTLDNPTTITYNGETFTRNSLNGTGTMLQPHITKASAVTVLGQANCSTATPAANCLSQAAGAAEAATFPWAVRSSNLTYVGEDPFSYISETDRYVAFSNLLYDALDPTAPAQHLALVRLEDVSPADNPATLESFADYFASQNIPFSVNVIPEYTDPLGIDNASVPACASIPVGQPCTVTLTSPSASGVVAALKYMESKGGTLNDEGFTHQYSNIPNPYTGISGDDAEFYRAQCSTTQEPPYNFVTVTATSPCPTTDYIAWTGPLPGDSEASALGRVNDAVALFKQAGLGQPPDWVTPHYFASVPDYEAIDSVYPVRYDRETFPSGLITGNPLNYGQTMSQFFPYVAHDVYGAEEIPENLGDYEPTAQNGNPARTEQDIINAAKVNLAVKQGVASFFYDAQDNPLANLETIVTGIKALGYTFVGPTDPNLPGA